MKGPGRSRDGAVAQEKVGKRVDEPGAGASEGKDGGFQDLPISGKPDDGPKRRVGRPERKAGNQRPRNLKGSQRELQTFAQSTDHGVSGQTDVG